MQSCIDILPGRCMLKEGLKDWSSQEKEVHGMCFGWPHLHRLVLRRLVLIQEHFGAALQQDLRRPDAFQEGARSTAASPDHL